MPQYNCKCAIKQRTVDAPVDTASYTHKQRRSLPESSDDTHAEFILDEELASRIEKLSQKDTKHKITIETETSQLSEAMTTTEEVETTTLNVVTNEENDELEEAVETNLRTECFPPSYTAGTAQFNSAGVCISKGCVKSGEFYHMFHLIKSGNLYFFIFIDGKV